MWGFCSLIKMNLFFGGGGKGYLISIHMNLISKFLYLFKLWKWKMENHKLWVLELQFSKKFSWVHLKLLNIFILDGWNIVNFVKYF